jgi:hypothetical protein
VRWIDLGCPVDATYDNANPEVCGDGWMLDDQRPTLALAEPHLGRNDKSKTAREMSPASSGRFQ